MTSRNGDNDSIAGPVLLMVVALGMVMFIGALLGESCERGAFEKRGYILQDDKVVTVTPIFEEWRHGE